MESTGTSGKAKSKAKSKDKDKDKGKSKSKSKDKSKSKGKSKGKNKRKRGDEGGGGHGDGDGGHHHHHHHHDGSSKSSSKHKKHKTKKAKLLGSESQGSGQAGQLLFPTMALSQSAGGSKADKLRQSMAKTYTDAKANQAAAAATSSPSADNKKDSKKDGKKGGKKDGKKGGKKDGKKGGKKNKKGKKGGKKGAGNSRGRMEAGEKNRRSVLVKGLLPDVTDKKIQRLCGKVGPVEEVKTARNKETGECLGYAWVRFKYEDSPAQAAAKLSGSTFQGKTVSIVPRTSKVQTSERKIQRKLRSQLLGKRAWDAITQNPAAAAASSNTLPAAAAAAAAAAANSSDDDDDEATQLPDYVLPNEDAAFDVLRDDEIDAGEVDMDLVSKLAARIKGARDTGLAPKPITQFQDEIQDKIATKQEKIKKERDQLENTPTAFVGNVPFKASENELREFLASLDVGRVVEVRFIHKNQGSALKPIMLFQGAAHIEFETNYSVAALLALSDQDLTFKDRVLRVSPAIEHKKREKTEW